MTATPVDDYAATWDAFHRAASQLVHHPLANRPRLHDHYFQEWRLQAFNTLGDEEFRYAFVDNMRDLAESPMGARSVDLLVAELASFTSYAEELLPKWDQTMQAAGQAGELEIQMPVPDSTGVEESHSVLKTVLESLMEIFPKLKGIFKACSEALVIKKVLH